jgi:transcription initiation factor TFIIE subunit alpha
MRKPLPKVEIEAEDPLEEYILKITNPLTLLVFKTLKKKRGNVTEEEIAGEIGISKNMTRKLLYKLHDLNIVAYRRIRDRETGWYHYYWRINWENLPLTLINRKREVIKKLREKLRQEEESQGVYKCPKCGAEYSFDKAFENEFRCSKCGEELVYIERGKYREILREYIRKLEEELEIESQKIQGG